jgi:hypothetical protein
MIPQQLLLWTLVGLTLVVIPPQLRNKIRLLAITSSANDLSGIPAPGSLATAFCTGLMGINGVIQAQNVPLPRSINGVRMIVGGIDAPLLAGADLGSYQQINPRGGSRCG